MRRPRVEAAALGALAVVAGVAVGLNLWRSEPLPWALVAALVLTLAPIVAATAAWAHLLPRPDRQGLELALGAALGAAASLLVHAAVELVVARSLSSYAVGLAALGGGLGLTSSACRLLAERLGPSLSGVAAVLAVAAVGAALSFGNYWYAATLLASGDAAQAAHFAQAFLRSPRAVLDQSGPLALAVGVPAIAVLIGWGLPAQVLLAAFAVAALPGALAWSGPDVHVGPQALVSHVELVAALLLPACGAVAARLARRPPQA